MARQQVALGVWVDPALMEQINQVATECRLSRSEWVRGVIVAAIRAHALKNRRIAAMVAYRGEPEL